MLYVDHTAGTQQIQFIRMENTGRDQVQLEFTQIIDNGVPGVITTLIAHNSAVLWHQIVYHAAFALIAPANSNDCAVTHMENLLSKNKNI